MREIYTHVLKHVFRSRILRARAERRLTQAELAAMLCMDTRSYAYLEQGETCCGALTLALFLIYCCDDPAKFLSELKAAFESAEKLA